MDCDCKKPDCIECIRKAILELQDSIVKDNVMESDRKDGIELIVIPGFSSSSYKKNHTTLFELYGAKSLKDNPFRAIHMMILVLESFI